MRTKRNSGFTLVEILIVVVILGILAAIVIPQFSNASKEANESNMVSNLQTLRSQVALYKIKNIDVAPTYETQATFETEMISAYLQQMPINAMNAKDTITSGTAVLVPSDTVGGWYFQFDAADRNLVSIWANSEGLSKDGSTPLCEL